MTSLGVKTITGLYIGISAVAFYVFMHAALTGQQLLTNKPTSIAFQQTSSSNSGYATTAPSGSQPSATSGSRTSSLASRQYSQTTNWAGYAATGNSFSAISASWRVPTISGSEDTSADATWIGIGGITSDDLIQVGTQNVISSDGDVSATAFYEMLPDTSVDIPTVTINPGDSVSTSIDEVDSGKWQITISDNTDGHSFTAEVAYSSSESSAEWIEEDPSDGDGQQIPLDSFGTVDFTGGETTENGTRVSIANSGAQAVSMINDADQALADISTLGSDGENFSVTRTSAVSGSSITEFNNDPGEWIRRGSGMGFGGYGYGGFNRYSEEGYGY